MKDILNRLGIVKTIDSVMEHQPEIGCAYGTLAQVVIINRLGVLVKYAAALCKTIVVNAIAQVSAALEWLYVDTTSIYFAIPPGRR